MGIPIGRSVLPRVLEGVRNSVLISVSAVLLSTALATVLGIAAGLFGGVFDVVVMRLADGLFAFPAVLLGIVVSAIVGAGAPAAVISIVIVTLPLMLRVFRSTSSPQAASVGRAGTVLLSGTSCRTFPGQSLFRRLTRRLSPCWWRAQ
jgi:ABC-type dipeptide/oligopeptide/nickel transport system permease subunit